MVNLVRYCDGERRNFEIPEDVYKNVSDIWEKFKIDIIEKNRYFSGMDVVEILNRLNDMPVFPKGTKMNFYRARIGDYIHDSDAKIMAPPERKASAGRCNPEGISYLYLANKKETAVSEVRPQMGDDVTVASCEVDVSKVFCFDVYLLEHYGIKANDIYAKCLLVLILKDLSSAITVDKRLDYIPLQYVAEYIKSIGYRGFMYKSIFDNGMNLVMFEWEKSVTITKKEKVHIIKSEVEYKEVMS